MNKTYLNDADGRKPRKLEGADISDSVEKLIFTLKQGLSSLWNNDVADIKIDQNVSTHVAYIIDIVSKKHKSVSVYLDSHEVFWMKSNIENGKLSLDEMSYPNYGPRHQFIFKPHTVIVFDPEQELRIVDDGSIPIIVYTHASRLTGQVFPLESIFKNVKDKYPSAICIADGAQMLGGTKVYPLKYTDVYIAPNSKFIGAELHLGLALLSEQFKTAYLSNATYPSVDLGAYKKELYSTNESLDYFTGIDFEMHIKEMRAYLKDGFLEAGLSDYIHDIQNQAPHIVTLAVGDKTKTQFFVESLERDCGISVSHNMGYSLIEPKISLVRVSISVRCKKEYIDAFISASKTLLST